MKIFLYISSVKFDTYMRYIFFLKKKKKKHKSIGKKRLKGIAPCPLLAPPLFQTQRWRSKCGSTKHMFNDSAINASITILAYSAITLLEFNGNNLTNSNQKQSRKWCQCPEKNKNVTFRVQHITFHNWF